MDVFDNNFEMNILARKNLSTEGEKHTILTCPLYNAQREALFTRLEESIQGSLSYQRSRNLK